MAKRKRKAWSGNTASARKYRANHRVKLRIYMRLYMRRWRAANLEVSRANVRDSMRRAKERKEGVKLCLSC